MEAWVAGRQHDFVSSSLQPRAHKGQNVPHLTGVIDGTSTRRVGTLGLLPGRMLLPIVYAVNWCLRARRNWTDNSVRTTHRT